MKRYSMLDQYAMGLVGPNDVPPFFYVEAPACTHLPADAPQIGVSFTGTRRDVLLATSSRSRERVPLAWPTHRRPIGRRSSTSRRPANRGVGPGLEAGQHPPAVGVVLSRCDERSNDRDYDVALRAGSGDGGRIPDTGSIDHPRASGPTVCSSAAALLAGVGWRRSRVERGRTALSISP